MPSRTRVLVPSHADPDGSSYALPGSTPVVLTTSTGLVHAILRVNGGTTEDRLDGGRLTGTTHRTRCGRAWATWSEEGGARDLLPTVPLRLLNMQECRPCARCWP